jgi:hypothetical protein
VTYSKINPKEKVKFNAFQNLDAGGAYWKELYGKAYTDWISADEYHQLNVLFQQRHLLSHTDGIVDQKYIDKSGDTHYTVGHAPGPPDDDFAVIWSVFEESAE